MEAQTKNPAVEKADHIVAALRGAIKDSQMRLRVWAPEGADFARIYTGFGSEYIQVNADLTTETSRVNMTWGHIIRDILEA